MGSGDAEKSYGRTQRGTVNIAPPYQRTGREDPAVTKVINEARSVVDAEMGPALLSTEKAMKKKRSKRKRIVANNETCTLDELYAIMPKSVGGKDPLEPKALREWNKRNR